MSKSKFNLSKIGLKPNWINVKFVVNSKIMKLTILIPIFGYLLLFNQYIFDFIKLSDTFVTDSTNENTNLSFLEQIYNYVFNSTEFRLYSYYFGLSFLGVSSLIYIIRCPGFIKDYDSHIALVNDYYNSIEPLALEYLTDKMKEENYINDEYFKNVKQELANINLSYGKGDESRFKALMRSVLRDLWMAENTIRQKSIKWAIWLYLIGFLVIAIPTLTIFLNVVFTIFK